MRTGAFLVVALCLVSCSDATDPKRRVDVDVVGAWALQSIDGHALPVTYYAPGASGYDAVADTLVITSDSTCNAQFTQSQYRTDIAGDTIVSTSSASCTWSLAGDSLRVWGFNPSWRTNYGMRKLAADTLVIDWGFGSTPENHLWRFSKVR